MEKPKKKAAKKAVKKSAARKKAAKKTKDNAAVGNVPVETRARTKPANRTQRKQDSKKPPKDDSKGVKGSVDPIEIARQTVKGSLPKIVETMVKKAEAGSCTHAKTLLEMTGAKHMFDGEVDGESAGEPWAKLVLERLDGSEGAADELVEKLNG